jgi:NAD(P)H-flavin reductase
MHDAFTPRTAVVVDRIQESPTIVTLRLKMRDARHNDPVNFLPGQFNMLYLFGVGEIPVSIVSDPLDAHILDHTIRMVGRVTRGFGNLQRGSLIGIRGPFGKGWPLDAAKHRNILIVTGGLGCAPVVSVIHYILKRRSDYKRLFIVQGVKHADDLIWRTRYEQWMQESDVEVLLAADVVTKNWPWHHGRVTELCNQIHIEVEDTIAMMCGPEPMLLASVRCLLDHGIAENSIWLSMERNMQCALGLCGHCQLGGQFVCKQGPVFNYAELKSLLGVKGM